MVSIKLKFRPSFDVVGEGCLFYQVIIRSKIRTIPTTYKILSTEWDAKRDVLILSSDSQRLSYLQSIRRRIIWEKGRLAHIIENHIRLADQISIDDVRKEFDEDVNKNTIFVFMRMWIRRLRNNGQLRTSETYQSTLNSFRRFRNNNDLYFVELDSVLLMSYERYLKEKGLSFNTISFYMRRLRSIYNKAVEDELIEQMKPFKKVYTSSEKTIKRAIPVKCIKKLKELNLDSSVSMNFARDIFLFSFYTRGMSFVDIAFLKKKDLKDGILIYRRKKTGQLLNIHWEPCMQKILNRYITDKDSIYMFPIIKSNGIDERKQYQNTLTLVNRNLKKIGRLIGLSMPLTTYVARHSWASIAKSNHIPISVISESMGHDSEKTTQIYLSLLDNSVIDKANKKILNLI